MWKLNKIEAENIASYNELSFSPTQDVATAVFGNNLDNPGQPSNGSGKSALLEAIAIGITGEPLRKVNAEGIINDSQDSATINITLVNSSNDCTFEIHRALYRRKSQEVTCSINGEPVVQSSVNEYNKFILFVIGIEKDDIYNNYILTEEHYKSFLTASDRDKKDIINRFSNGILVDKALENVAHDIKVVSDAVEKCNLDVSKCSGSIEAVKNEIEDAKAKRAEEASSKESKISDLKKLISDKEKEIENISEQIKIQKDKFSRYKAGAVEISKEYDSDKTFDEEYKFLGEKLDEYNLSCIVNWANEVKESSENLKYYKKCVLEYEGLLSKLSEKVSEGDRLLKAKEEALSKYIADNRLNLRVWKEAMDSLNSETDSLKESNDKTEDDISSVKKKIREIDNVLLGTIQCPSCGHKFIVESSKSIEELKEDRKRFEKEIEQFSEIINTRIAKIDENLKGIKLYNGKLIDYNNNINVISGNISEARVSKSEIDKQFGEMSDKLDTANSKVKSIENEISNYRDDMIEDVVNRMATVYEVAEGEIKLLNNKVEVAKGMIETYNTSIKELEEANTNTLEEQLTSSLNKYQSELETLSKEQEKAAKALYNLSTQERRFVEFKTYLANTKIEALSRITNSFLEQIGSDTRIKYSGYTVLRNGNIRDKIAISLIRDGVDCGSIFKFSKGERARVNLANILAMHKLTNVSCDSDGGLDLLILDEVLDGTDEGGLNNILSALNTLGITSLVVSHGKITENYPHKLVINKQNGISYI